MSAGPSSSKGDLGRVVVGYRHDSMRVRGMRRDFGIEARNAGRCIAGCGYDVFLFSGGVDVVRERDALVVCEPCRHEHYAEILARL